MPEDPYSLGDLARLADVTPRTIRYYVAQGLLPSPEAAGPATRYGEGHLARLRLIRRLQRDHLPLAEIRARLEQMGDDEVRLMLDATPGAESPPAPGETLAFVQDLMARSGLRPRVAEAPAPYLRTQARFEPLTPDAFPVQPAPALPAPSLPSEPAAPMPPHQPSLPALPAPGTPRERPDRTTWERHQLTPDVELHVRRPLDRHTNKRVDQLIRIARELFDELP
ncbi:MAG TPA: MerR family transcriptional regulator [Candidatus Limnocylindrales bacterium]|nr:MerR family transcriptional regulator [Candidatus Limnocylindrales bacterium]